jgi:hypothetical protein
MSFYIYKGKINVKAKGYWFTSGGEKGSFGYDPHLKDEKGCPVYPDTQLKGNLKMAFRWLNESNNQIFSRVYVTDLELSKPEEWDKMRFQIKPRITINPETNTAKEHMLAFLEMAYLEDLNLEADIYLAYLNETEKEDMKLKINQSLSLLGGMGAFRSRGYGKGEFSIKWDEPILIEPASEPIDSEVFYYVLTPLVNFRNKFIEPGSYPNLSTLYYILDIQLKGWFVKAYHELFNIWPTPQELSSINFTSLYPCLIEEGKVTLAVPPPVSILKDEKGTVKEIVEKEDAEAEPKKPAFFETKAKPLPSNAFITLEESPRYFYLKTSWRVRNSLDDYFLSSNESLFAQEFIHRGQSFGGIIKLKDIGEFTKKAYFIFKNLYPAIKGCLFRPEIKPIEKTPQSSLTDNYLVKEPLPVDLDLLNKRGRISLSTIRSYNIEKNRPRRPLVTIKVGSIVKIHREGLTIPWEGKDRELQPLTFNADSKKDNSEKNEINEINEINEKARDLAEKLYTTITNSQIGNLRLFCNKHIPKENIDKQLNHLKEKYNEDEDRKGLYTCIESFLKKDRDQMTQFIERLIEEIRILKFRGKKDAKQ